jgi:hypothetical protein
MEFEPRGTGLARTAGGLTGMAAAAGGKRGGFAAAGAAGVAGSSAAAVVSLQDAVRRPWLEHAEAIAGALVYLDEGAGEALAVSTGPQLLLGARVRGADGCLPACLMHACMHAGSRVLHRRRL